MFKILSATTNGRRVFALLALTVCTAIQSGAWAQLLVNEFDYAQPGIDNAEFIELYVTETSGIDLGDFSIDLVDGATGTVYTTIALDSVVLPAGEYYVVCGALVSVPNCDQVAPSAVDFIQNDQPSAVAIMQGGQIIDTISYGGDSISPYTETLGTLPDDGLEPSLGLSRSTEGVDLDFSRLEFGLNCVTPGASNSFDSDFCDGVYDIHDIQGDGLESQVQGEFVEVRGSIVTAISTSPVFQGFYMEAPLARRDENPDTSEGIFVRTQSVPSVQIGDEVNVVGTVDEVAGSTMIAGSTAAFVISSLNPTPQRITFDTTTPSPNMPSDIELERFEGMQVQFTGVAVEPLQGSSFIRVVSNMNRTFREPGQASPAEPDLPVWDGNPEILSVIVEDTDFSDQEAFAGQVITIEGSVRELVGYSIEPSKFLLGAPPALPRAVRQRLGNEMVVASQNLNKFFDSVDDPATDDAVYTEEVVQQRLAQMSNHLRQTLRAPDVIALQEVETLTLAQQLASRIHEDDASLSYSVHYNESDNFDGLDLAFLTRDDTISVDSLTVLGETEVNQSGFPLFLRLPLQINVTYQSGAAQLSLTVVNVQQDAYSTFGYTAVQRQERLDQSVSLAQKMQALQSAMSDVNLIVLGDFGAPQFTDGEVDVLGQVSGAPDPQGAAVDYVDIVNPPLVNVAAGVAPDERYSLILNGNSTLLDHVLANDTLASRVITVEFSRGNADSAVPPSADFSVGSRVSDRDGLAVFLQPIDLIDTDGDGVDDSADNCTITANPGQFDADGDGYGNACDADFNNDCVTNFFDISAFAGQFLSENPVFDINEDGAVNFFDFTFVANAFQTPPGPGLGVCN